MTNRLNTPTRKDPPLTYVPLDHVMAPPKAFTPTPERPSRLWGYVYYTGALIAGFLLGLAL